MKKRLTMQDLKARGSRCYDLRLSLDEMDYQFILQEALVTRRRPGAVAREILEAQIAELRDAK